jgi:hypothetical protein
VKVCWCHGWVWRPWFLAGAMLKFANSIFILHSKVFTHLKKHWTTLMRGGTECFVW